jgi:hypothetical protein
MKAKHIEREAAPVIGGKRAARLGKAAIAHGAAASFEAAGDRQIDEIERTFTHRYEW